AGSESLPFRVEAAWARHSISSMTDGPDGGLWASTYRGLLRVSDDDEQRLYPTGGLSYIAFDAEGTLWATSQAQRIVYALRPERTDDVPIVDWGERIARARRSREPACRVREVGDVCVYAHPDSLPVARPIDVLAGDGSILVVGEHGLARLGEGGFRPFGRGQPSLETRFNTVFRDADDNLWLGGETDGLLRIAAGGMVSFERADGLRGPHVVQILDSPPGELVVVTLGPDGYWLHVPGEDGRFHPFRPRGLGAAWEGWAWNRWVVRDRAGEWWIPAEGDGLYRYPAVERAEDLAETEPIARYTIADGLPGLHFFRSYESRRGDLWLGLIQAKKRTVVWRRADGRFESLDTEAGLPESDLSGPPTAFAEDSDGRLWLGFYNGGLARSLDRTHRRFELFGDADGVPPSFVQDLYFDSRGWLWIAAKGAVLRVKDPGSPRPVFERLTQQDGLSAAGACCFAEDRFGHVYVGNDRGVDRLDPATGSSRHLTTADGLASHGLRTILAAASGELWFGTWDGLSRLQPRVERPSRPPATRIGAVRVAGVPWPVPELGAERLTGLTLRPHEHRLTVGFFSIALRPGEVVRYQHRLEGTSDGWSPPSSERSVTFAGLPTGELTFQVRAVGEDGSVSAVPATLTFERLPPVWRRGWFLAVLAMLAILSAWTVARLRSAQRRALERQRARIASDLHDELGSGLGGIGIVAELLAGDQEIGAAGKEAATEITTASRELGAALSDIVWALDSKARSLPEVAGRLAQRGATLFSGNGTELTCYFPEAWPKTRPAAAVRRSVLLIGLEGLYNAARHAAADRVELILEPDDGHWRLAIRDDGRGLGAAGPSDPGHGMASMRRRAAEIGAQVTWRANSEGGTTVELTFALRPRKWRRKIT
ncbi:MAG: histidine kinase, partial [Acidobacteriota bacterium]